MTAPLPSYILAVTIMMTEPADKTPDLFQAIADPKRRRLLELLHREERCVQDLVPHLGITIGAVSQHLKVLLEAGLVTRRKAGRHRYYRADPEALAAIHSWIARFREDWQARLDRLEGYLKEPS